MENRISTKSAHRTASNSWCTRSNTSILIELVGRKRTSTSRFLQRLEPNTAWFNYRRFSLDGKHHYPPPGRSSRTAATKRPPWFTTAARRRQPWHRRMSCLNSSGRVRKSPDAAFGSYHMSNLALMQFNLKLMTLHPKRQVLKIEEVVKTLQF